MKQLIFTFILLSIFLSPLAGQNQSSPSPPSLLSADIIPGTDSVKLSWKLSDSADVQYYGIFEYKSDGRLITYSMSPSDTCITFSYPPVIKGPVNFRLVAYDSLTNSSILSNMHTTNFLQLQPDSCSFKLHMQWSGYSGWGENFALQRMVVQFQNEAPQTVKTLLPATLSDTITVSPSPKVCIWIESADKEGRISRSNTICLEIPEQDVPHWISADYASILSDGSVELSFHWSGPVDSSKWVIERKTSEMDPWEEIKRYSKLFNDNVAFTDPHPTLEQPSNYRLCVTNPCYVALACSEPSSTLILQESIENNTIKLNWNSLVSYPGGVEEYKIYHSTGADPGEYLGSTGPANTAWEVDIHSMNDTEKSGKQCFFVEAIESGNNPYGIQGISRSNLACVTLQSRFRMPNAFTPNDDGINDVAGPVFTFYPESFRMVITDAYGKILFRTENPSDGWDGTSSEGQKLPPGSYIWYISFRDFSGKSYEEHGSLSIIYP